MRNIKNIKLELDHITKTYGEGEQAVTAVDEISLSVAAGELVAVVGPSGSGKTTLLAIAGALLHPTTGRVIVDGQDLSGLAPDALSRVRLEKIGFVLQSANLVPYLTVQDQLLLVSKLSGKTKDAPNRAKSLLAEVGLSKRLQHYPEQLSGGERQRVSIARALMNDPLVVLADEPTASLDSRRGREVVEMLRQEVKTRQKAALMVTHDERMLDLCDRVVRLVDGRLTDLTLAGSGSLASHF
jgi:putative ABC transport system ATP-binding protein